MYDDRLQQILVALERQRAENAGRDAARAKENAERDAARTKELSDLRTDFVDRDAARSKEIAGLRADMNKEIADLRTDMNKEIADLRTDNANARAETARGFQHMTMWFAAMLVALFAGFAAIVGVGLQLVDRLPSG